MPQPQRHFPLRKHLNPHLRHKSVIHHQPASDQRRPEEQTHQPTQEASEATKLVTGQGKPTHLIYDQSQQ